MMHCEKGGNRRVNAPMKHLSVMEVFAFILIAGAIAAGWFYVDMRNKREELTTRRMDLDETRVRIEKLRISTQSQRLDSVRLKERINLLES